MKRGYRVAIVSASAIAAVAAAPLALRHVGFFRVRQIELVGVRYLAPDTVVAALGLRPRQNVFDDLDRMEGELLRLPGVVQAGVERRLPGTLRVSVVERVPVAFAPGADRLVAFDGEGRPLPYDPAATGLDLPVISRLDSLLVRTLSVVRLADSALFQEVDAARRTEGGSIVLALGARRVLLPGVPAVEDVRAVGAVRRHLATTGRRYGELDARFGGWIVVRRAAT